MLQSLNSDDMTKEPIIRKTWVNNPTGKTIIISIPNELASKHGIKIGSNLVVEDRPDGILYRKLELK
jgi:Antidote-toxin recognition MazE, bacterial antitoxin